MSNPPVDPPAEPEARPEVVVDQFREDVLDQVMIKWLKLPNDKIVLNTRSAVASWTRCAKFLRLDIADGENMLELRDLVVRFLVGRHPPLLTGIPGEIPIASAKRALQVWTDFMKTKNKAEVEELPAALASIKAMASASRPRSERARSPASSQASRASLERVTRHLEREAQEHEDLIDDPDDNDLPTLQNRALTRRDLVNDRQMVAQVRRTPTASLQRPFDLYPVDIPSCEIPLRDVVTCERWVLHDPSRMLQAVTKYFVHDVKSNPSASQVQREMHFWCRDDLPSMIDKLKATYDTVGPRHTLFTLECLYIDKALQNQMRKRLIVTEGARASDIFVKECQSHDPQLPDWMRFAAVAAQKKEDFRYPAQEGATGSSGNNASRNQRPTTSSPKQPAAPPLAATSPQTQPTRQQNNSSQNNRSRQAPTTATSAPEQH